MNNDSSTKIMAEKIGTNIVSLILTIEKLPYFPDYINNSRAAYPFGNVLFPKVKSEGIKVKNCHGGQFFVINKNISPLSLYFSGRFCWKRPCFINKSK